MNESDTVTEGNMDAAYDPLIYNIQCINLEK